MPQILKTTLVVGHYVDLQPSWKFLRKGIFSLLQDGCGMLLGTFAEERFFLESTASLRPARSKTTVTETEEDDDDDEDTAGISEVGDGI